MSCGPHPAVGDRGTWPLRGRAHSGLGSHAILVGITCGARFGVGHRCSAVGARIDGRVDAVAAESGFLYSVSPIRTGGGTGLPQAVERTQGTSIAVDLEPVDDPGLYTFAGWNLQLDPAPTWNVSLGGTIEADLSALRLTELQMEGDGIVTLGQPIAETPVRVSGDFEVRIPTGTAARVVGEAVVPEDWAQTGGRLDVAGG